MVAKMWPCFICSSDEHNCGHREPELVAWVLDLPAEKPVMRPAAIEEPVKPPVRPVRFPVSAEARGGLPAWALKVAR